MVAVAQRLERELVELEAAGSNPVSHPKMTRNMSSREKEKYEEKYGHLEEGLRDREGKGSKKKGVQHGKETYRAIHEQTVLYAQERRRAQNIRAIRHDLKSLVAAIEGEGGEELRERFERWVERSFETNRPVVEENDLEITSTTASAPGGQHMQHTRTAAVVVHIPTLISVKNEEERSFPQNKDRAQEILENKLSDLFHRLGTTLPQAKTLTTSEFRKAVSIILSTSP